MAIDVPFVLYESLAAQAEAVQTQHNVVRTIPIPIEDIVDVGYAINIVRTPNLETSFGAMAFISQDLQDIRVDDYTYQYQPYRLRFSLAHELAHLVLHREVYQQMTFDTPQEWKSAMNLLNDESYKRLEWQADCFAGLLLVPSVELRSRVAQITQQLGKIFREFDKPSQDYSVKALARQFGVSAGTIWYRIRDERFI